jgi:hypothetical protein
MSLTKFAVGLDLSNTFSRNRRSFNDDTDTGVITNAIGASPADAGFTRQMARTPLSKTIQAMLGDPTILVKSAKEIRAFTNNYRVLATAYGEYALPSGPPFSGAVSPLMRLYLFRQPVQVGPHWPRLPWVERLMKRASGPSPG